MTQILEAQILGSQLMHYHLLQALVLQGCLTQEQASTVAIDTADALREATEGTLDESAGEDAARSCERLAKLVLENT